MTIVKWVFYINELYWEKVDFHKLKNRKKEKHVKIRNTGRIHTFSCDIIEISNC